MICTILCRVTLIYNCKDFKGTIVVTCFFERYLDYVKLNIKLTLLVWEHKLFLRPADFK